MEIYEQKVPSTDGIHTIYGKVYVPDGQVSGIVQIVHGKSEHIGRYDRLMRALADSGYVAFGNNHIGHMLSSTDDELGFFGYSGGFRHMIDDVNLFGDTISAQYPDKKRFLFGHSMGSFIVRLAALRSGDSLSGLIVCGTGGPQKGARAGLFLSNVITLLKGGRYVSPLLDRLAFSKYNERFEQDSPHNWLTTDKDEVKLFADDRYSGFDFGVCGMHDLIMLNFLSNKPIWALAIKKDLPILLISGSDDPVGDYGKGVEIVYNRLQKAGCDVKMKLYPGARHEILNEHCKQEVTNDILSFINAH